jgi:oxygen-independent coproporphyrinogen-3 oxidase
LLGENRSGTPALPRDKWRYEFVYQYPPPKCIPEWNDAETQAESAGTNGEPPAFGLYVHIPFCRTICTFCHYARYVPHEEKVVTDYLLTLEKEAELAVARMAGDGTVIASIHCGGGTPTFLSPQQIGDVVQMLNTKFKVSADAEMTWESTPDTIDEQRIGALVAAGCNRLSIGAQCFDPEILGACNRQHSPQDVERACALARAAKIKNVNFDIIFGLPHQNLVIWMDTVRRAVELGVSSLTLYHLRIKEGTHVASLPPAAFPTETECDEMYVEARNYLLRNGFVQCSPSCFIRSGQFLYRHQHDKARGGQYLGLGLSAYSYVGDTVLFNTRDAKEYETWVTSGRRPAKYGHRLTPAEKAVRRMILALRYSDGADIDQFVNGLPDYLQDEIENLQGQGYLTQSGRRLEFTEVGLLRADEVCACFYAHEYKKKLADQDAYMGAYFDPNADRKVG